MFAAGRLPGSAPGHAERKDDGRGRRPRGRGHGARGPARYLDAGMDEVIASVLVVGDDHRAGMERTLRLLGTVDGRAVRSDRDRRRPELDALEADRRGGRPAGLPGAVLLRPLSASGEGFADSVELLAAFAYLADRSQRLEFGPLVVARLVPRPGLAGPSGDGARRPEWGALRLGVGAGWMEREHAMFGYALGDRPARMARLAEALEVIDPAVPGDRAGQLRRPLLPPARGEAAAPLAAAGRAPAADRRLWPEADAAADGALRRRLEHRWRPGRVPRHLDPAGRADRAGGPPAE